MTDAELERWFAANKTLLETAYLAGEQPWQQSGFGLHSQRTYAQWEAQRRPIAACMDRPGAFLDIGCANGYLLECAQRWTAARGIAIDPFGLDFSAELIALARQRLPAYADQLFVGNAWDWTPPRTFDYVRTELVYVPDELHQAYVARLLDRFLAPGGKLLVAAYRTRENTAPELTIDCDLATHGFVVASLATGLRHGVEQTRVAVISKRTA
jgi:SAM-dependent methyltransferase